MLRLLILLECDQCQETMSAAHRSSQPLGFAWDEGILNLEYRAELNGWSIYRSQHICDGCVIEAMAAEQKLS